MELLLWAERRKLRRSKILWIAGFATVMVALIVFAQGQFTFYESRYIDGAGWFMTAAQSLATFYVLPAVIALLGSYMICREEQEDTLKSLRLIPVDEVKLTLAISNLVENAIKYNKEYGYVKVSLDADHQFATIMVEDNGIGIPEEAQEHIFERFYRVDKSHSLSLIHI